MTNDTDAVSHMFTGVLVDLVKNIFIIFGVVIAMFLVNIKLALVTLCFAPVILFFTIIQRFAPLRQLFFGMFPRFFENPL